MIVRTCMSSVSEHGKKLSELKSGICKYMRRGEADKLKWCVMEIARFQRADAEPRAIKGIITNLINRLKILLMEEIHANDVGILKKGLRLLREYDDTRDKSELLMTFCDIISQARRTRSVSYLGNWWKFHETGELEEGEWTPARKGDSPEIQVLARNLERFVKEKDERMFGIYNRLYQMGESGEKAGCRYRRRDPAYIWWEILEKNLPPSLKSLYDFGLEMYFRKGSTERRAFGVWVGMLVWRYGSHSENIDIVENVYISEDVEEYYENMKDLVLDEYVVKDYHVDKRLGLGHFAKNGAWVKDEDLSLLDRGEEYRELYISKKIEMDTNPKKSKKNKPKKNGAKKKVRGIPHVPQMSFEDLRDIFVIEEGVCGGKVPCIIATYEGKKYVLKMMRKSMNYGADYMIIDKAKSLFGLASLNMRRVTLDRVIERKNKKIRTFVKNWEFSEGQAIYCMMDYFENVGDIGKNKGLLINESVVRECVKIRLFDGLFRSSDNIMRNILVNSNGDLLSIDEGDMFGKRQLIFNKRGDWCKKNISGDLLESILDDLLEGVNKVRDVQNLMLEYGVYFGEEFKDRFNNYREVVRSEF